MEQESRIRTLVRQAIDPVAPSAPWLPDQVMAAVRDETGSGTGRGRRKRLAAHRRQIALIAVGGIAALLVIAVVATVVVGSRLATRSHPVPAAAPTPDPTVAAYQAMVDRDIGAQQLFGVCIDQNQPDVCRSVNEHERATAQRLSDDLASANVPAAFSRSHEEIKRGITEVLVNLAAGQSAIDSGDQTKAREAQAAVTHADLSIVRPAIAQVHCYPRGVAEFDDSTGRYPCSH